MIKKIGLFLAIVMVALAVTTPALADDVYARIRGTITDATGAGVPDVKITAANSETGFTKVVNTGADGNYEFLNLPPGPYDVNATKTSFVKVHWSMRTRTTFGFFTPERKTLTR